ncbi:MAG: T9SS type A sorting domain-containing protein, partial [Bacteroidota bacterium]
HYQTTESSHRTLERDSLGNTVVYTLFRQVIGTVAEITRAEDHMAVTLRGEALSYRFRRDRQPSHYDSVLTRDYEETRRLAYSQLDGLEAQPSSLIFDTTEHGIYYVQALMTRGTCGTTEKWFGQEFSLIEDGCDADDTFLDGRPRTRSLQPHALGNWGWISGQGGVFSGRLVYRSRGKFESCGFPYDFSDIVISTADIFGARMKVFPNPVVDRLTVTLPYVPLGTELVLFDSFGRLVHHLPAQLSTHLVTTELPAGIYFLVIRQGSRQLARRKIMTH